jgi:methyl-accepting chemotaxis protein
VLAMDAQSFRRKYLTNPPFQFRFIGIIVGFSAINLAIIYIAQRYFFLHYVHSARKTGLPVNHIFFQLLKNQQQFMDRVFFTTAVFILVFGFIFGTLYSHKITGPLSRLKDFLDKNSISDDVSDTNFGLKLPKELEFRDSDYFGEIALSLNEFIKRKSNK